MKTILALCALSLVAAAPSLGQTPKPSRKPVQVAVATCVGADPCRACKNCKYCKRCNDGSGRVCGICKPRPGQPTKPGHR